MQRSFMGKCVLVLLGTRCSHASYGQSHGWVGCVRTKLGVDVARALCLALVGGMTCGHGANCHWSSKCQLKCWKIWTSIYPVKQISLSMWHAAAICRLSEADQPWKNPSLLLIAMLSQQCHCNMNDQPDGTEQCDVRPCLPMWLMWVRLCPHDCNKFAAQIPLVQRGR